MGSVLRWSIAFRFLTGNPSSKIKPLFPLLKVNISTFLKGYKKPNRTTPFSLPWSIVQFKVVASQKECETMIFIRSPSNGILSRNLHNRLRLGHSLWNKQRKNEFWGLLDESCRNGLFKNMRQLGTLLW